MSVSELPAYADQLDAFHCAFEAELRTILQTLPISPAMQVLDVGCGDGFYLGLLAEKLTAPGGVVGLDNNPAFLDAARSRLASQAPQCRVDFLAADLESLQRQPSRYDLVWCAQSLYSLPEPVAALKLMRHAVRPGGFVVVLENDTLHQLLLPWPMRLELAIRAAEFTALADETRRPEKYYIGRRLPAVLAEAGLEPLGLHTHCIDRTAPLGDDLERFVKSYLERLYERTGPYVDRHIADQFAQFILPDGEHYLLRQPHFALCWMNVLAWGRRPL